MNEPTIDATTNLPSARLRVALGTEVNALIHVTPGSGAQLGNVVEVGDERVTLTGGSSQVTRNALIITSDVAALSTVIPVDDTSQVDADINAGVSYLVRYEGDNAYPPGDARNRQVMVDVDHDTSTVTLNNGFGFPVGPSYAGALIFEPFEVDGVTPFDSRLERLATAPRTTPVAHPQGSTVSKVLTVSSLATTSSLATKVQAVLIFTYSGGAFMTVRSSCLRAAWEQGQGVDSNITVPLVAGTLIDLFALLPDGLLRAAYGWEIDIIRVGDGAGAPVLPLKWYVSGPLGPIDANLQSHSTIDYSDTATANFTVTAGQVEVLTDGVYVIGLQVY